MTKTKKILSIVLASIMLVSMFALATSAKVIGDVNGDGKVSVVDAKWVLQGLTGGRELTAEQEAAADLNGDGKVSVVDAKWILQIVAGIRNEDGGEKPEEEPTEKPTEKPTENKIVWDYDNGKVYFTASTGEVLEYVIESPITGFSITNITEANGHITITWSDGHTSERNKCDNCGKYLCDGTCQPIHPDVCPMCGKDTPYFTPSRDGNCIYCGAFIEADKCHHCPSPDAWA